jgi:hypothetical protein
MALSLGGLGRAIGQSLSAPGQNLAVAAAADPPPSGADGGTLDFSDPADSGQIPNL